MQAALGFTPSVPFLSTGKTTSVSQLRSTPKFISKHVLTKLTAVASDEPSATVDYSSKNSVFPAEACETIGGDACDASIFPEAKLKSQGKSTKAPTAEESVDREYLEYNESKTVFPDEACDDLGGEFCEPENQKS